MQSDTVPEYLSNGDREAGDSQLSIVIPTYNERSNIIRLITRILETCKRAEIEIECIVVDDDSPDRTWELVRNEFCEDDRVRVVHRTEEHGLGSAVVRGVKEASSEFVGVIDADLQHPPQKIPDLYASFDPETDLVVGTRRADGGSVGDWSVVRQVISRTAELFSYVAFPRARQLSDPMSGFFIIRRNVINPDQLNPTGFKILLEILARGEIDDIAEVPYTFRERANGESNLSVEEYVKYVEHMLTLGLATRGIDRYIQPARAVRMLEFGMIGASGTVINTGVFLTVLATGSSYLLAGVVAFLVAVNWNFAGNWLLTYNKPDQSYLSQYTRFHLTSVGGFVVYTVMLWLLFDQLGLHAVVANVGSIIVGAVANFVGTEWFAIGPYSS